MEVDTKELTGKQKGWTFRENNLVTDAALVRKLVEENQREACRIFITGESHVDFLGKKAVNLLLNCNESNYNSKYKEIKEPLFLETKQNTIRMRRYDPMFIWHQIEKDFLVSLLQDELDRLGLKLDPWAFDHVDFYQSMVALVKAEKGENYAPFILWAKDTETYYQAMYLTCLFLFGKPGYFGVHISEHFADPAAPEHLKYMEYRLLSTADLEEVRKLRKRYGGIKALTNPEISFTVDLLTRNIKEV